MNSTNKFFVVLLTASFYASAEIPNRYMPDGDISKVGNILSSISDPKQLTIYSQFKVNPNYTQEMLCAFKESGKSLNTKMKPIRGNFPSVDLRPIENAIYNRLPYASRHPFILASASGILGATTMFGVLKAYEAGYFNKAKNAFETITAKYIKR